MADTHDQLLPVWLTIAMLIPVGIDTGMTY